MTEFIRKLHAASIAASARNRALEALEEEMRQEQRQARQREDTARHAARLTALRAHTSPVYHR